MLQEATIAFINTIASIVTIYNNNNNSNNNNNNNDNNMIMTRDHTTECVLGEQQYL